MGNNATKNDECGKGKPDIDDGPPPKNMIEQVKRWTSDAFGVGLVLVVLPSAALMWGISLFERSPVAGLPVLAIFGITILFGALALISTLFARLELSCSSEALALPPGSIRAAIALALIVLFALISVMLYQSLNRVYEVPDLSVEQKNALVQEPRNVVLAVLPTCPQPKDGTKKECTKEELRYTVHLRQPAGTEAADLAKQLLILIGTLMTSVTSFYFASRSSEAATKAATKSVIAAVGGPPPPPPPPPPAPAPSPAAGGAPPPEDDGGHDHEDGCDAPIENPTSDVDLPPAKGGVAS